MNSFFSGSQNNQMVNQWLCIAFLGVFCFWVVLYFFTQRAEAIGSNLSSYEQLN